MSIGRVGVIGMGIMGLPMARNLMKAGCAVSVHTRTRSRADLLLQEGAEWAGDPSELAAASDVVISIVPDSPDVEQVYLGPRGVIEGVKAGCICVDMSTVSPEVARTVAERLADKKVDFLDAPVSGGKTGAETGRLSIMAGGEAAALDRARPVLEAMGSSIVHCGPVGHGQLTKLCNQVLCAVNLVGVAEAISLARAVGLDAEAMLKAVSGGAAGSWALTNLGRRMLDGDFEPMFMVDLQQKDLRLALAAADSNQVPLPGVALAHQLLSSNQACGEGRKGTQVLLKVYERLRGSRKSNP